MTHLPPLIQDLAIILTTAAFVALLFRRLNLPVVLGYLVAGLLVGPHFTLLPTVVDGESVKVWAEIGVIVLLFNLGLEFSFRKLMNIGPAAVIAGLFQIGLMLVAGYFTGRALGWSEIDCLYLGGILSISSTTIIAKALDELGMKSRSFVPLVLGILIVEDLVAILLLVILSTMAVTKSLSGGDLAFMTAKLLFFMLLWIIVGTLVLPRLMRTLTRVLTDETTLVIGLGLCLLMVVITVNAGFSPALGAFVMGSLLSETVAGPRIEHLLRPVKDLFGAVFFVSMGMLVDPAALSENPFSILLITVVLIVGKTFGTSFGAVLAGQPLTRSIQAGLSLAQIGEFGFIIAALGASLGVTGGHLTALVTAVAAITTFTTPFQIKHSTASAERFNSWLPERFRQRIENYRAALQSRGRGGLFFDLLRIFGRKILVNSVLIIAITLAARKFLMPVLSPITPEAGPIATLVVLIFSAPFFYGLVAGTIDITENTRRLRGLELGIAVVRSIIGLTLLLFVLGRFLNASQASMAFFILVASFPLWAKAFAQRVYLNFERELRARFEEDPNAGANGASKTAPSSLAPWDASLVEFEVSQNSEVAGQTLMASAIKERFGVTVALIERGNQRLLAPGREARFLPGDRVFLIGTDLQIEKAGQCLTATFVPQFEEPVEFGLTSMTLSEYSEFIGKPIRASGLRERIDGLIVGLEREGHRLLSPDSGVILKIKDLLWVVGDLDKIKKLRAEATLRDEASTFTKPSE